MTEELAHGTAGIAPQTGPLSSGSAAQGTAGPTAQGGGPASGSSITPIRPDNDN